MREFVGATRRRACSATTLAEEAAAECRAATAFLYALARLRLSPYRSKNGSAAAPAFDAIREMTLLFTQTID
jgi:hypothetical protein